MGSNFFWFLLIFLDCIYKNFGHHASVLCIALSSDDSIIASGSSDKTVMVWETNTGNRLYPLDKKGKKIHDGPVFSVSF